MMSIGCRSGLLWPCFLFVCFSFVLVLDRDVPSALFIIVFVIVLSYTVMFFIEVANPFTD